MNAEELIRRLKSIRVNIPQSSLTARRLIDELIVALGGQV